MALDLTELFEDSGALGGMSKDEAIYSILWIAASIDGVLDEREKSERDFFISRSKTLKGGDAVEDGHLLARLEEKTKAWRYDPYQFEPVTINACASLLQESAETCKSVFVQAVDIVYADDVLHENEQRLLDLLRKELRLDNVFADKAVRILDAKNRF
ncbi:MAG: hypothetical protein CME93_01745 [Hyphomonadaceae bacterium]|nr:hypothetical protein [Hyphomonadaceae bacterium]OUX95825.1 MAG: hypothetical protein CBB77_01485 [Hyphomonas sp. TMED17]